MPLFINILIILLRYFGYKRAAAMIEDYPITDTDAADIDQSADDIVIEPAPEVETPELTYVFQPKYLFILDSGHGKFTSGKRSPILPDGSQLIEYEYNRDLVQRIVKLARGHGLEVVDLMEDHHMEVGDWLKGRVTKANGMRTDLIPIYISLHGNAAPAPSGQWCDPSAKGLEVWHFYGNERTKHFAGILQACLVKRLGWVDRGVKSRPSKQFYVLRNTEMDSILSENGFFNNYLEVQEMMKDSTRENVALAHLDFMEILEGETNNVVL